MKTDRGDHPGKQILLINQAFPGLPPYDSKKKIQLFSQAGYKLNILPNPFICYPNNCTPTFLLKPYRKSPRKTKRNDSDVATPPHLAQVGKNTSKARAHSSADGVPSLTTSCSSQKNLSQLPQCFGVVQSSRRLEQEDTPHSRSKMKLNQKRTSMSFCQHEGREQQVNVIEI